jgi:hypothetical protein
MDLRFKPNCNTLCAKLLYINVSALELNLLLREMFGDIFGINRVFTTLNRQIGLPNFV